MWLLIYILCLFRFFLIILNLVFYMIFLSFSWLLILDLWRIFNAVLNIHKLFISLLFLDGFFISSSIIVCFQYCLRLLRLSLRLNMLNMLCLSFMTLDLLLISCFLFIMLIVSFILIILDLILILILILIIGLVLLLLILLFSFLNNNLILQICWLINSNIFCFSIFNNPY